MNTKIIIKDSWRIVKEYPLLITLTTNDVVEVEGVEHRVNCCLLDTRQDIMLILLDK